MICCGGRLLQHNSSFSKRVMIPMHKASEPVKVENFNPDWASWFVKLSSYFKDILGTKVIRIEHVGSTSIPGMVAKPIIDFDIVIRISDFEDVRLRLEETGYVHQGDLGIPEREAFALHNLQLKKQLPPHHLYVCDFHSKELHRHIIFRDYLREYPEDADEYSKLKIHLVKEHSGDRESYIQGKACLVQEILEKAFHWSDRTNR